MAKSMIPKIRINKIGKARANSNRACAAFLRLRCKPGKEEVEELSIFMFHPING
jgi:hypothetical protein